MWEVNSHVCLFSVNEGAITLMGNKDNVGPPSDTAFSIMVKCSVLNLQICPASTYLISALLPFLSRCASDNPSKEIKKEDFHLGLTNKNRDRMQTRIFLAIKTQNQFARYRGMKFGHLETIPKT